MTKEARKETLLLKERWLQEGGGLNKIYPTYLRLHYPHDNDFANAYFHACQVGWDFDRAYRTYKKHEDILKVFDSMLETLA